MPTAMICVYRGVIRLARRRNHVFLTHSAISFLQDGFLPAVPIVPLSRQSLSPCAESRWVDTTLCPSPGEIRQSPTAVRTEAKTLAKRAGTNEQWRLLDATAARFSFLACSNWPAFQPPSTSYPGAKRASAGLLFVRGRPRVVEPRVRLHPLCGLARRQRQGGVGVPIAQNRVLDDLRQRRRVDGLRLHVDVQSPSTPLNERGPSLWTVPSAASAP
jgi:hypothetical protein